jgi:hypothetical protein
VEVVGSNPAVPTISNFKQMTKLSMASTDKDRHPTAWVLSVCPFLRTRGEH